MLGRSDFALRQGFGPGPKHLYDAKAPLARGPGAVYPRVSRLM